MRAPPRLSGWRSLSAVSAILRPRALAPAARIGTMKTEYSRNDGAGPTYEIEADRHGNYTIKLQGKVIKRVTALSNYLGKPRWGSSKLENDAIEDAKRAIDALKGEPTDPS
jgi:hypothetical protein